ncbi:winged helix DNA-binding protein [Dactylosporangium fulvum]|uniref:MarR family winged helix-turn-helix transcriptional regulator n=1 Tax=Dactylosporangium fulvum TaxID=53359 RepID=A0ABY5W193_9ACTN|nr:helix-turn-helix domain-containing protein [Dactylosporangium fulvum]UWP83044.1 MarR family winged helix-turn-helix transcriptional regulator [Dactylosporangium fulvum]
MKRPEDEPQIGALLRMAWETLHVEVYGQLRAAGFDDLREVHRPMLRYPPIDGMRPTELAAQLRLSKQATNDLIRDLEKLNYVRLERDPSDGRARVIRYTDRGWRLFRTGSQLSRDFGQRWARALGQQRYDEFSATLRTIVELGRPAQQPPS